ncbi:probable G-protein coupled receptor Mth-like 3 isoform X2 [Periplaneta americana]|uniref:probable G-protein coupled receptor Mth-like 3 isoform X2 n=1 Tax=Periplaneta americana TaxID=6978 RepID=UPI0037E8DFA8
MLQLALFSLVITMATAITINKCCGADEVLVPGFTCLKTTIQPTAWLPPDVNTSRNTNLQIGAKPQCQGRQHFVFTDDSELFDVTEDGRLILYDEYSERNTSFRDSSFCFDNLLIPGRQLLNIILLCPCTTETCIRKCCLSGSSLDEHQRCRSDDEAIFQHPSVKDREYFQLNGLPQCPDGTAYLLNSTPSKNPLQYWFLNDGRVDCEEFKEPIPVQEYCWDVTKVKNGSSSLNLLYCKRWEKRTDRRLFYGVMLLIDSTFLSATLIVYAVLPELRTGLHARHLMAHTASFLVAYLVLGIGQLLPEIAYVFCLQIAFIIQFAFLAAFFWLNVMCIDIAWAFSGLRPPQGSALERDHKKFILYSVYAWGTAGLISVITAVVEFVPGLADDSPFKPNFGRRSCWFEKPAATLAYFYGPMAFLILANLILFLYTAARIISVRRDTAILNSAGNTSGSATNKEKQRLVLYVKLFCLMGLTWITEIISWAVGGADYYWYITDVVNMLRAVFIFVIFCCKRSVLNLLRARLPCSGVKRIMHSKSGTSFSVPTSSLKLTTSFKMSTRRLSQET